MSGNSYTAGATGGEATHTLTVNEMPSHNHNLYGANDGTTYPITNTGNSWNQTTTGWTSSKWITNTGGSAAHNNMPPYLVVYGFKRVA